MGILAGCAVIPLIALLPTPTTFASSFGIDFHAVKTWNVSFALLDVDRSAGSGGSPLLIDQSLRVSFEAMALGMVSVEAELDDRQPESLQVLVARLDVERLSGLLGDFTLADFGSGSASRKMLGLRVDYQLSDDAVLAVFASQAEGILQSRTFVGETAKDEVSYGRWRHDQPWVAEPYERHIDGLDAYALETITLNEEAERALVEARAGGDRLRFPVVWAKGRWFLDTGAVER